MLTFRAIFGVLSAEIVAFFEQRKNTVIDVSRSRRHSYCPVDGFVSKVMTENVIGNIAPDGPYDRTTAPLKVRMLKAEVIETLLYGCVTWTLRAQHFAQASNDSPRSPVASHRLPAPTSYWPCHPFVREGPQDDNVARAARRPLANGGSSLRGAWHGNARSDSPVG